MKSAILIFIGFFAVSSLVLAETRVCSVVDTILRPANNSPCFARLAEKLKNEEDRAWLLKLTRTWSPPANLIIRNVPGGFQLYQNNKIRLDARWVQTNPPILYWNGQIKIGNAQANGSLRKLIHSLVAGQETANFDIFLQNAYASEATGEGDVDFLTLFTTEFGDRPMDAATFIKNYQNSYFPALSNESQGAHQFHCSKYGLDDYVYEQGAPQAVKYVLKALEQDKFAINGVAANKTFYVDFHEVHQDASILVNDKNEFIQNSDHSPQTFEAIGARDICDQHSLASVQVDDLCKAAWAEYHARYPLAAKLAGYFGDSCRNPGEWLHHFACVQFWNSKKIRMIQEPPTHAFYYDPQIYLCTDPSCTQKTATSPQCSAASGKYLDEHEECGIIELATVIGGESKRIDPGVTSQGWVLNRAVMSAKVLSECCHLKGCPEAAKATLNINLIQQPAPSTH